MEVHGGDVELAEIPHADQADAVKGFIADTGRGDGSGDRRGDGIPIDINSNGGAGGHVVLIVGGGLTEIGKRTDALQS